MSSLDSAKNSLTTSSQLLQESDNVECRLAVEAARWLVEEKEELRLGGEFDTDC